MKHRFEACYSAPHTINLTPEVEIEVQCERDGRHNNSHKVEKTITGLRGEVTFIFKWDGDGIRYRDI